MEGAVALYLRLSQEDMDIRKGAARDESDSIRSQRMMLRTFLKEVGGQAVLGRQRAMTTPWLTERHGYEPTWMNWS